jgi:hypothetical protein
MRRALLLLAFAIALAGRVAAADEPPHRASLGWVRLPGAEACIGTRELALAVEQRLGRAVFASPSQADMQIDARIEPVTLGFRAHLTLSNARGEVLGTRDLDAPESACRAVDEQIVLVMAMLLDPEAALSPPRAPLAPLAPLDHDGGSAPKPLGSTVVFERVFDPQKAPPPAPRATWRESLWIGPAMAAGLLPGAGVGLSLRGEIEPPSFIPIELGGVVWKDTTADATTGPARGANVSLAYAMLGLCPLVWGPGATRVRGCADLEVGTIRAVGFGFAATSGAGQEQPVAQAQVAGRVTQRMVGPLELGLGLGLVVPFERARFFYLDASKNQQELFRTSSVAAVVEASVGVAFP